MDLDRQACDRARQSRDARFDGRFFIAVTTTRIYCRPICPAPSPKDQHIQYFPTAAAAEAAGFRPCLRCRPEAAPGTPAWSGTSAIVSRALRLIGDGALDEDGVGRIAERVGVTDRHLRRLFLQHLGATPLQVALTRRAQSAKTLLDETNLSCADIAFAAGFGSLRRFNGHIRRTYGRTPTDIRRRARRDQPAIREQYRFRLAFRPPYDWQALIGFLRARATPGVERVDDAGYSRTIAIDGHHGVFRVSRPGTASELALEVRFPDARRLLAIVARVRAMFDLGADPSVIADHLGADPLLRTTLCHHAGIRVPGAWDGFELAVRAIIGQQISVKAATTMAGRVARMFGTEVPGGEVDRLFPTPVQLATAPLEQTGIIKARAEAIRALARRVSAGTMTFDRDAGETQVEGRGIGPWTAQYIAMRAFGEPDAFLTGDLVLRRMAGGLTAGDLDRRAAAWRPWRAYAVMLLWQAATDASGAPGRNTNATSPAGPARPGRTVRARRGAGMARADDDAIGAGGGNPLV